MMAVSCLAFSMMTGPMNMPASRTEFAPANLAAGMIMRMIAFWAEGHVGTDDSGTASFAYLIDHLIDLFQKHSICWLNKTIARNHARLSC
jgi:hypothetical protein